jgi:hypothetical protein
MMAFGGGVGDMVAKLPLALRCREYGHVVFCPRKFQASEAKECFLCTSELTCFVESRPVDCFAVGKNRDV